MKNGKNKFVLIIAMVALMIFCFVIGASAIQEYEDIWYDVTFYDDQGNALIYKYKVRKGESPDYDWADPTHSADLMYEYMFEGWILSGSEDTVYKSRELPPITNHSNFIAKFTTKPHESLVVQTIPATCKKGEICLYTCSDCGLYFELEVSEPISHSFVIQRIISPTCTSKGYEEYACSSCGLIYGKEVPTVDQHFYEFYRTTATCEGKGTNIYNCLNCGKLLTEEATALGHLDKDEDGKCERCYEWINTAVENHLKYIIINEEAKIVGFELTINGEVYIPATLGGYPVTTIEYEAFNTYIPYFKSFEVEDNNNYFSSDEYGVLYNKDKTELLYYPTGSKNDKYSVPETVKTINSLLSYYLETLVIPDSVKEVTENICSLSFKDVYIYCNDTEIKPESLLCWHSINQEKWFEIRDEYTELCEEYVAKLTNGTLNEEEDRIFNDKLLELEELILFEYPAPYGTIHANAGSTAEAYAKENGINFELLTDDEPQESTTVKDTETNVEIEFDSSAFETEISLVVSEDAVNADIVFGDEYENYKAFDISIEANGEKVQPKGYVTVKLPIPADFNAETTVVYYVDENGNKEEIESTVEDGFVIFETDHFSEYVLVDESTKHEHSHTSSVTKAPTCTEQGTKTFTCSCGDSYTETIPSTGHSHNKVVTAPTCTAKGYTTYTCSCGDSYVADYVNALGHKDNNGDYKCDYNCGYEYEKPAEPEAPSDPSENCSCNCHKGGFMGFIWKIINFFQKLFKANPVCACGAAHY